MDEETPQEPQIIEEKNEESPQVDPPKNSGSTILIVVILVLAVILAVLGYLGYKYINGTNPSAAASKTSTAAAVSSATLTASAISTVSGDATPTRDQALSVLARKHFDWVIAEQKSGEDMIASETYKNVDYLTQSFKDEVKSRYDSWQMNPLTMSTEPITRYVIQGNYAQPNGTDGQIDLQVFSTDKAWNVVLTAQKENGVWLITDIGSAG